MDLQKEKHNYLAMLVTEDAITQEQCSNLSLHNGGNCFHSDFLASSIVDCINWGWQSWLKARAIPDGFVLVEREKLAMILETATNALVYHAAPPKHDALSIIQGIARKAMIEAQEQGQ